MTITAVAHCDAHTMRRSPGPWGIALEPCHTAVALRTFTDRNGETRRYCPSPGHRSEVERRFGVARTGAAG